jgi:hypothetical protein
MKVSIRVIIAAAAVLALSAVGVWGAIGQDSDDNPASGDQLLGTTKILLPDGMSPEEAIESIAPLVDEYQAKADAALEGTEGVSEADAKVEAASFQHAADVYQHMVDLACERIQNDHPDCPVA